MNLKAVDLNLLVLFEAIYSAGNISHAANKLAMSQPAVSNSLARLRDVLDDPLFVRARGGVEPTTKSKAIIGPVREALGIINTHLSGATLDLKSCRRTFRISTMDVLEPLVMPPLINLLAEHAPETSIESVAARPEIAQDVLSGTLDIACFPYPTTSPEISIVPIGPVDPVMIARSGHPLIHGELLIAAMKLLRFVALSSELRGFTQIDRELLVHDIKRRVVMSVSRLWSMPAIVAETDLVGIVPRAFAHHIAQTFAINVHELPVQMPDHHLYMMWNVNMNADLEHRWLRERLLDLGQQRLGPPIARIDVKNLLRSDASDPGTTADAVLRDMPARECRIGG